MIPGCESRRDCCGGLDKAYITDVQVDAAEKTATICAYFAAMPSIAELKSLSECIRTDYALSGVGIVPDYPRPQKASGSATTPAQRPAGEAPKGTVLLGKAIKQRPAAMSTITLESGRVTVEGDVVAVNSRSTKKGGAVLGFDLTDYSGSLHVSRFLKQDEDQSIIKKIAKGDHLTVQGEIAYNKFEDDMVLDPRSIVKGKRYIRPDTAEEKRVELHLHTRFSALDALTEPKAAVERAAYWGMPAIAVTDHGVAQAFPDMWTAGRKYGVKIIYGTECYFVNDMDGNSAVIGKSKLPLDGEMVAFDIETTGLNAQSDRMTEIGAVIFAGGEIKASFNSFVDPERPIPADITELTGIRDSDVAGAPSEGEALRAFLDFVGDRPLAAHNAHFDVGFMMAAAARQHIRFAPVYVDTLALSQALCPELKRFKLDVVSNHLGLPKFNHHRASDDALVVARMMGKFLPMLHAQGAKTLDDAETVYHSLRRTDVAKTWHMTLLVTNRKGLKNLYELSLSV